MKSVRAGEYTAPPAQGPKIADICGITPEARMLRSKISAYPANEFTPSWIRAPPESFNPMIGAPTVIALSMTLQIFWANISESAPPNTVKSCANTNTIRPLIVPCPVTTPSPRNFVFSMPKLLHRCVTNISNSSKLSSSSNMAILSRAVYLPFLCWDSIRFSPPPNFAWFRKSISSLTLSWFVAIKF